MYRVRIRSVLQRADCRGADFIGANLCGANLHEARMQGADITGAIMDECKPAATKSNWEGLWTVPEWGIMKFVQTGNTLRGWYAADESAMPKVAQINGTLMDNGSVFIGVYGTGIHISLKINGDSFNGVYCGGSPISGSRKK